MKKASPSFLWEERYGPPGSVAGVDEAGRGPWAGPVVAAATVFLKQNIPSSWESTIHDSKKLSPKSREKMYQAFQEEKGNYLIFSIGIASVEEIDTLNILQATFLAMSRAIATLPLAPHFILVDGNKKPNLPYAMESLVKGDQLSYSIAASSILAKVERDRIMKNLHEKYPWYDWVNNAGYGTSNHQKALAQYGISPHHRTSYKPIKQYSQSLSK